MSDVVSETNPVLVGFCSSCEYVVDPYPGSGLRARCDGDDEAKDTPYYHHRLHRRLMWKCAHEDCEMAYWTTKEGLEWHLKERREG